MLNLFILISFPVFAFGAAAPKPGDIIPSDILVKLQALNSQAKKGDLIAYKNSRNDWLYAEFVEKYDYSASGSLSPVMLQVKTAHDRGVLVFQDDVKSLQEEK